MRRRFLILLAAIVLLCGSAPAGTPLIDLETGAGPVSNFKARQVGDVVTIIITEESTADASSQMDTNSKSEISGGPGLGFLTPFGSWGLDTENKYQGDGSTSRSGKLQA